MKKRIPQSILGADQKPTYTREPDTAHSVESSEQCNASCSVQHHIPVTVDGLIDSIAERNRDAMQSNRQQKKSNKAALNSVLRSIFSPK